MVARVQKIDDRAMGLGLGGEIGAGGFLDLPALGGLPQVGGVDAGEGGGTEIDHVALGHLQAQLVEQTLICGQELGIVGQEPADVGRRQRRFRHAALGTIHPPILEVLEYRLTRLGPVGHELIKAPFG